jgi:hypothetical protein
MLSLCSHQGITPFLPVTVIPRLAANGSIKKLPEYSSVLPLLKGNSIYTPDILRIYGTNRLSPGFRAVLETYWVDTCLGKREYEIWVKNMWPILDLDVPNGTRWLQV